MLSILKDKKFKISTLGCKVNQYESDAINEILRAAGCQLADESEEADICIINTCSVTNIADRKSRQIIHRMRKQTPTAVICATGCYVQAVGDKILEDSSVNLIIGNNRKKEELTTQEWFEVINQIPWYSVATLVGGEPLIRKDFIEILMKVSKKHWARQVL